MKKGCVKCILLAVLICFLILSPKTRLKAASVKITEMSEDLRSINVVAKKKITNENQFYDLKVTKGKKTVAKTSMTEKTILYGLKKNNVYILYVRKSTYQPDTGITTHTKWSRVSKFCTALPGIRVSNKKKASGFWLKMPKIKGITKYKIYIVYDRKSKEKISRNYKLYCTMKSGKKKKINKYQGKSLDSKSGVYYIKVVPYKKKTKVPGYGTLNKTYDLFYKVY